MVVFADFFGFLWFDLLFYKNDKVQKAVICSFISLSPFPSTSVYNASCHFKVGMPPAISCTLAPFPSSPGCLFVSCANMRQEGMHEHGSPLPLFLTRSISGAATFFLIAKCWLEDELSEWPCIMFPKNICVRFTVLTCHHFAFWWGWPFDPGSPELSKAVKQWNDWNGHNAEYWKGQPSPISPSYNSQNMQDLKYSTLILATGGSSPPTPRKKKMTKEAVASINPFWSQKLINKSRMRNGGEPSLQRSWLHYMACHVPACFMAHPCSPAAAFLASVHMQSGRSCWKWWKSHR